MRLFTIGILLLAISPLVPAQNLERSITIVAQGYVEAVPDTLSFPITIKYTEQTLLQARAAADLLVNETITLAMSLGIPREDIDSSSMQAFPEYEWRNQQRHYLGESVMRTVVFTLQDLDKYPELVRGLSKRPLAQIGSPTLGHSNMPGLQLDALRVAIGQGKLKAAAIASEVDAKLGKVISISEVYRDQPQPRMLMAEAANVDGGGGYNYGKRRISADVEMRFLLE